MTTALFIATLGTLRPADEAAAAVMRALPAGKPVSVKITRTTMNTRRNAFFHAVLAVAAENMAGRVVEGTLDAPLLKRIVKRKLGFGTWTVLPSGEREFVERSMSARACGEPERADFIARALALLETWLGVPADELLNEAHARNPALGGTLPGGRAAMAAQGRMTA